jgi:hypothetical protein
MGVLGKIAGALAARLILPTAQIETLSRGDMVSCFQGLRLAPNKIWFDQGTGNARTLARQARRFPQARFIGTDFENFGQQDALARWLENEAPENLVYGLFHFNSLPESHPFLPMKMFPQGWPKGVTMDDEAARLVERQWGSRFASVISLFYPHTASPTFFMKMEAALAVLRDGGTGVVLIDNRTDTERTLAYLRRNKRVRQIQWSPEALDQQDLRSLDIAPYQTTHFDNIRGPVQVILDHPHLILFTT